MQQARQKSNLTVSLVAFCYVRKAEESILHQLRLFAEYFLEMKSKN